MAMFRRGLTNGDVGCKGTKNRDLRPIASASVSSDLKALGLYKYKSVIIYLGNDTR